MDRTRLNMIGTDVASPYEPCGYDELNRPDYVRYPDASEVEYTYDPNGNLETIAPVGGTAITYGYDDADQLQEVDSVDLFDYDNNGNRIGRDTDTYSWDWSNRLTEAEVGGTTAEFDYLGDNTRAAKTVDTPSTTEYLWDRASGLSMLLSDGTTSVVHSGAGATEVDDATDDRLWDLTDGLGSVRAQADDTGAVTGAADYDVWGTELSSTTNSLFSWTGEQNDDETGLTYLRNRYYSPTYSRFLSQDPIQPNAGGTQGFNAYTYAQNNPATLTDPSGMLPGWDKLSATQRSASARGQSIIRCMLDNDDVARETECVLALLGINGSKRQQSGDQEALQGGIALGVALAKLAARTLREALDVMLPVLPRVFVAANQAIRTLDAIGENSGYSLHMTWDVYLQITALEIYARYYFTYQYFEYRNRQIDKLGMFKYPVYIVLFPYDLPLYVLQATFLAADIGLNQVIRKTGVQRGTRELNDEGLYTEIMFEGVSERLPSWADISVWAPGWHCDSCGYEDDGKTPIEPREPGRVDFHFLWWDHFTLNLDYGN